MAKRMKVKMLVSIASARFSYRPNEVIEIDADLAKKWIAAGHCERVAARQSAAVEPGERAVQKSARAKKV